MSLRLYPQALEDWWLNTTQHFFNLNLEDALHKLVPTIQQLSDLFTTDRPSHFKDYGKLEEILLAYGIFFFPQSFIRCRLPLEEVIQYRNWQPLNTDSLRILDLGAGLGGGGLGIGTWLLEKNICQSIHIHAIDHSSESLKMLHNCHHALQKTVFKNIELQTTRCDLNDNNKLKKILGHNTWDIILLSFSMNECLSTDTASTLSWFKKIKPFLNPKGIICILEPALQKTSQHLYSVVDTLLKESHFYLWGPRLHPQAPCPISEKFWNHEVRTWPPPPSLQYTNRTLWRSIHELKFSYAILSTHSPKHLAPSPNHFRLSSPMVLKKSGFLFSGIATDGQWYHYEIPKKNLNKEHINSLEQYERGDILKVNDSVPLNNPLTLRIPSFESITHHYTIAQ